MANEGINSLARTLEGRIKDLGHKSPLLDFGEIQNDMSLVTNNFPPPIPQGHYMVCRSLTWGAVNSVFTRTQDTGNLNSGEHIHGESGSHPHGASGGHSQYSGNGIHTHPDTEGSHTHPSSGGEMQHIHDVLVDERFRGLQPGDRVLVAWLGNDACVIDIIYPASIAGQEEI